MHDIVKVTSKYYLCNSFTIQIMVTDKCNYNCQYCYNDYHSNNDINFKSLLNYISIIKNRLNKDLVFLDILGGEPTLHPGLYDFCKKLSNEEYINYTIYSNFSSDINLYENILNLHNSSLCITYHHINEKQSSQFIQKLQSLSKYSDKIEVKTMFENNHFNECLQVYDFIKNNMNFKNMTISLIESNKKYPIVSYTNEQISIFREKMNESNIVKDLFISFNDNTEKHIMYNSFLQYHNSNFRHWRCNAGFQYVNIDVFGDIFKCHTDLNNSLGNINSSFKIQTTPIICMYDKCPCKWDIYKEKVFDV